jgi:streptomycin 3"-adenylyltransferase
MRSRNWSRTLTERSGGNGAVAVFMACYDCFFVQSMPRASKQQARYAVGRCLMLWSSNDVTQQGSRPKTKLGIMGEFFPAQVFKQLSHARAVIERHLAATLDTIHLFGSAIDGGLKPDSDIDLLVTVSAAPNDSLRQALMLDLLKVSSPPGDGGTWRPLELTVVARSEVVPWRYPARRELQFGEWLRHDILSGTFEPAVLDHDLAILLTKARQHSLALLGPSAATFFEPVPKEHFSKALFDTIAQWNAESDWKGDERNVVLALARIWYSASTGLIAPKDVAAAWVSERLPAEHRPLICKARAAYLGSEDDDLAMRVEETAAFVRYAKATIERILR